jgi:hypothetical protein
MGTYGISDSDADASHYRALLAYAQGISITHCDEAVFPQLNMENCFRD